MKKSFFEALWADKTSLILFCAMPFAFISFGVQCFTQPTRQPDYIYFPIWTVISLVIFIVICWDTRKGQSD